MAAFASDAFDAHESVHQYHDAATGLHAIIAVHSTALGPAAGGCRVWEYPNDDAALRDALRLSRGMTYKNAMAGLPFGGGKGVVLREPWKVDRTQVFEAFGRCVDSLGGTYITAADVGASPADIQAISAGTKYVVGLPRGAGAAGGDPSPVTADGVFLGIQAAMRRRLGTDSFAAVRVAIQGVGKVGYSLCRHLHAAGAKLVVADVNEDYSTRARDEFDAKVVAPADLLFEDVEIVAPCALGAVLDRASVGRLQAKIVAGAANNQLATDAEGARLRERGILYAPDYVINGGGIISVTYEYLGDKTEDDVRAQVEKIPVRLTEIFAAADRDDKPTHEVADEMARRIIARGRQA